MFEMVLDGTGKRRGAGHGEQWEQQKVVAEATDEGGRNDARKEQESIATDEPGEEGD